MYDLEPSKHAKVFFYDIFFLHFRLWRYIFGTSSQAGRTAKVSTVTKRRHAFTFGPCLISYLTLLGNRNVVYIAGA